MLDLNQEKPLSQNRYLRTLTLNGPRARSERAIARRFLRARASLMRDSLCSPYVSRVTRQLWFVKDLLERRLDRMADLGFVTVKGYFAWSV